MCFSFSIFPQNIAYGVVASGGTITYDGEYIIHTFTSSGSFVVSEGGEVEYLIVGAGGSGGGTGGSGTGGGGGGAGGYRTNSTYNISSGVISVVVGTSAGQLSSFDGIESAGGGNGGAGQGSGNDGGSGGGSGGKGVGSPVGGTGNIPNTSPRQGNNGGTALGSAGAGGGGAGANATSSQTGAIGLNNDITGTSLTYSVGGNGGSAVPTAGTAGTGCQALQGCVIIRYLISQPSEPLQLFVNHVSTSSNELNWLAPLNDRGFSITGYKIERESPINAGFSVIDANTGTTSTTFIDTSIEPNTEYNYRVSAISSGGTSPPSNESSIISLSNTTILTSELLFNWQNITNAIVFDVDKNGYADNVYTYTINGQNITFLRMLGQLNNTNVLTLPTSHSLKSINVYEDKMLIASGYATGSSCITSVHTYNISTGLIQTDLVTNTFNGAGGTANLRYAVGMTGISNEGVLHSYCGSATNKQYIIKNSTNTILNSNGSTEATFYGYNSILSWADPTGIQYSTDLFSTISSSYFPLFNLSSTTGHCSSTVCLVGSTPSSIKPVDSFLTNTVTVDPNIKMYNAGMELPSGVSVNEKKSLWKNYIPTLTNNFLIASLFHIKILDENLSLDPYRLIFEDTTYRYLIYLDGSTVRYSPLPDSYLDNRSFGYYIPDTTPDTFDTFLTTSSLSKQNYNIYTPSNNFLLQNAGVVSLVSGYKLSPNNSVNRYVDSQANNNDLTLVPYTIGATSGLTTFNIIIKNNPSNSAVDLRDLNDINSNRQYSWFMDKVQADKSVSVELPSNLCVEVFVKDLNDSVDWISLGNLCNSGTMPKTITYSSNLSLTFFSLPYGVAHSFNQGIAELTTKVRHNTLPYNYTVQIYDSNGALQYDTEFLANSTKLDTQSINVTGISLPALMRVYDDDGNQLYYTTLGSAGYLSQTVAWFNEWLTIEGFNLLFMLPIVFGAMFTRNTVGIGTMSTVMLIATLSWFGVIPIPDVAIYLMIFVSVVGVIAYKKLYD